MHKSYIVVFGLVLIICFWNTSMAIDVFLKNLGKLMTGILWEPTKVATRHKTYTWHERYCDVIMGTMASRITSLTIVYSTVYSDADERKHQSSASLGGNSPGTGEFPAQMASNLENVSIWWRNHEVYTLPLHNIVSIELWSHDDVMACARFPHCWPFVWRIPSCKWHIMPTLDVAFVVNKMLNK